MSSFKTKMHTRNSRAFIEGRSVFLRGQVRSIKTASRNMLESWDGLVPKGTFSQKHEMNG